MKLAEVSSTHKSEQDNQTAVHWDWETPSYLHNMWNALKQISETSEAVVRHTTLTAKVVMVRGDELVEGHTAVRIVL